jgi:hypothetical protein
MGLEGSEGEGEAAAPGAKTVLSYGTGARRRSWRGWLFAIGLAQGLIGVAMLSFCGASMDQARRGHSYAAILAAAFLIAAAMAGICQTAAGLLLLVRRWGRPRVVRLAQQLAIASLVPIFLFGAAVAVYATVSIYRGNDPFAGFGVVYGVGIAMLAGILAVIAMVAVRVLRPDAADRTQ